jgi:dTDP-4-dehydrorhamnose 3,5-epimerase
LKVTKTEIPGVLILEPPVFEDERGFFFESFNKQVAEVTGFSQAFVQDNQSHSKKNVLRGLHYQLPPHAQGKVVRVVTGEIFDVAVDLRRNSPTFGRSVAAQLSAENRKMMWIPPGFAHGFLVLSESADCVYKASAYYSPQQERTIVWNDTDLKIKWPLQERPVVSGKDAAAATFRNAQVFE